MGSSSGANPLLRALVAEGEVGGSAPPTSTYQRVERPISDADPVTRESENAPRRSATLPTFYGRVAMADDDAQERNPELSSIQQATLHIGAALDRIHVGAEFRAHEVEFLQDLLVAARDLLGGANQQQIELCRRVMVLEQAVERGEQDRKSDRTFLQDQYDSFIARLVDDHDNMVRELTAELEHVKQQDEMSASLRETLPPPPDAPLPSEHPSSADIQQDLREELGATRALLTRLTEERERSREALLRLQQQRDDAQAAATRVAQERDDALADLNRLATSYSPTQPSPPPLRSAAPPVNPAHALSTPPVPTKPKMEPLEFALPPLPTLSPLADELDAIVAASTAASGAPSSKPVASSKPVESSEAPVSSSPEPRTSSKPQVIPQKPHPSTRPLIGYSVGGDTIAPERLEGAQISSRPPKR